MQSINSGTSLRESPPENISIYNDKARCPPTMEDQVPGSWATGTLSKLITKFNKL